MTADWRQASGLDMNILLTKLITLQYLGNSVMELGSICLSYQSS